MHVTITELGGTKYHWAEGSTLIPGFKTSTFGSRRQFKFIDLDFLGLLECSSLCVTGDILSACMDK